MTYKYKSWKAVVALKREIFQSRFQNPWKIETHTIFKFFLNIKGNLMQNFWGFKSGEDGKYIFCSSSSSAALTSFPFAQIRLHFQYCWKFFQRNLLFLPRRRPRSWGCPSTRLLAAERGRRDNVAGGRRGKSRLRPRKNSRRQVRRRSQGKLQSVICPRKMSGSAWAAWSAAASSGNLLPFFLTYRL